VNGLFKGKKPTPLLGCGEPAQGAANPGPMKAACFGFGQFATAPLNRHIALEMSVIKVPR
jgi:hypothetical protein